MYSNFAYSCIDGGTDRNFRKRFIKICNFEFNKSKFEIFQIVSLSIPNNMYIYLYKIFVPFFNNIQYL